MSAFTTLAHSYNSRGELSSSAGNGCPCRTCRSSEGEPVTPMPAPAVQQPTLQRSSTLSVSDEDDHTPPRTEPVTLAPPPPVLRAPLFQLPPRTIEEEEADILRRLSDLRKAMKARQNSLYNEPLSHRDQSIADLEWDDLEIKISAIKKLLRKFRSLNEQ